jgi:hypothetical protein
VTHPSPGTDLEDFLAEIAAVDPPRASGRCTLDLPGTLPRKGLLAIGRQRARFLQQDPFGVTVARDWDVSTLSGAELGDDPRRRWVRFRTPEGDVEATGFEDAAAAEALWSALVAARYPGGSETDMAPAAADMFQPGDPAPTTPRPPPPTARLAAVAGVLCLTAAGGVVGYLMMDAPPVPEPVVLEAEIEPAMPTAPDGLKGLSFGQTVDQVRAEMPEMQSAVRGPAEAVSPAFSLDDALAVGMPGTFVSVTVPGEVWVVDTSIGTDPASCDLHFAVDDGLSRMRCQLDPLPSHERHVSAETGLVATLTSRYGAAATAPGTEEMDRFLEDAMGMRDRSWGWAGERARLELTSSYFESTQSSEIVLDNVAAAHDRLLADLQEKASRVRAERAAEERARREAEAEAAREQLGDTARRLEEDL